MSTIIFKAVTLKHPSLGVEVLLDASKIQLAISSAGQDAAPISLLKRITKGLNLPWIDSVEEQKLISSLPELERITVINDWTDFLLQGTRGIITFLDLDDSSLTVTEKVSKRLSRSGIDVAKLGFTIHSYVEPTPPIDPKTRRLETIPELKDYGMDDERTYAVFDHPLPSHHEAQLCYKREIQDIQSNHSCTFIRASKGYADGKLEAVLRVLNTESLYEKAEDKNRFHSVVLKNHDPKEVISEVGEFLKKHVKNEALLAMELEALGDVGPFNRYPTEYWEHKLMSSYAPKSTSFDFDIYRNAWKIVARLVKKAIAKHDSDMIRRFPKYHSVLKLSPDSTNQARERKRSTSNAGFPTFGKYLDADEWNSFETEVDGILKDPFAYDPTHYPMIVGNRIVGKDLHIPDGLSQSERFDYIKNKNKQRIIQMGSSVEFILGSKFTHPLFRVLSKYSEPFQGMKSWTNVRGSISRRMMSAKLAFGADASNFDASVTIFDWLMVKRLFQLVYPQYTDVLEWYFTLCAYSPTITLSSLTKRPVLVTGCSGVASGVACTAVVDSIVELVRAIAIAIEIGILENSPLAEFPDDFMAYVCGDDLAYILGERSYTPDLTAEHFCSLYKKYGGEANPEKQLVTTNESPLGLTLLFLKRLFSVNKDVGFGTRLVGHAMVGLLYCNPYDQTSAGKIISGFLDEFEDSDPVSQEAAINVALSDEAHRFSRGDLSGDGRAQDRANKQVTDANKKGRKLLLEVDQGKKILDEYEIIKIHADPSIKWIYRVSDPEVLERFVDLGILSEEDAEEQVDAAVRLRLFSRKKMHLIKAVQQLEDCHPNPYFVEFVELIHSKNPEFFDIRLLEGDEAAKIARYLRGAQYGKGLYAWKIFSHLRRLFIHPSDEGVEMSKALVERIAQHGSRFDSCLELLSECHSMPLDRVKATCRTLIEIMIRDRGVFHIAKCYVEEERLGTLISLLCAIKTAAVRSDFESLTKLALEVSDAIEEMKDVYTSFKRYALIPQEAPSGAGLAGPNEQN